MTTAKMLVRRIVEKMLKTISFDVLKDAFPNKHLPLLLYLQKALEKRQRKKYLDDGDDEDDEDEDDAGDVKMSGSEKNQKKDWQRFNEEDYDDGPGGDDKNMTWDATKLDKKKAKSGGDASMNDVGSDSIAANPAMHPSV